jgi:hypothetical protein
MIAIRQSTARARAARARTGRPVRPRGSRFVAASESGAHPLYKQAVADAVVSTEITGAFSVSPLCATVPRARVLRSCVYALRDLAGAGTLPIPKDSILRALSAGRSSRQTCSTSRPVGLARPVVAGQFMWLSAINGRPDRRSDDGRMILRAARAGQELRLDLLFCGAPLRNRTVDLLLTICNSLGSPPGQLLLQADGKRRPGSSRGLRHLRSLRPSRRLPRSRWWSMPSKWQDPTLTAPGCRSGPASGAACRPATSAPTVKTRSDDLCCPARPGPEGTSRRFLSPGRFEPLPLSSPRMKATAAAQESPEPKITPRHMQDTESGPGWQGAATSIGPPDSAE